MKNKVGIINSGGDCPGLNTVIDAIVQSLHDEYEILGFYRGFEGLLTLDYLELKPEFTKQYRFQGGTFLKTVNHGNFSAKVGEGESQKIADAVINKTLENYQKIGLHGLIVLGGDGSMSIAGQLTDKGINIIGVPKSIDNDLYGTHFTFGFKTAVEIATDALDRLITTAYSHDRVMILEVMGRNAGWIGLYAGIAGGADIILIPEIPFSMDVVINHIKNKIHQGQKDILITVSEGATQKGGNHVLKNVGGHSSEALYGGIGDELARQLNKVAGIEARATALGHVQRGGPPVAFDRVLSRGFGVKASEMFKKGKFNHMVSYWNGIFGEIEISEAIRGIKLVHKDDQMIAMAKSIGICFGDR